MKSKFLIFLSVVATIFWVCVLTFFLTPSYVEKVKDMNVNVELSSWTEQPADAGYIDKYLDYYGVVQTKYEDSKGNYWITLNNDVVAEIYCGKQYKAISKGTKIRVRGQCKEAGKQLVLLKAVILDCNCD